MTNDKKLTEYGKAAILTSLQYYRERDLEIRRELKIHVDTVERLRSELANVVHAIKNLESDYARCNLE